LGCRTLPRSKSCGIWTVSGSSRAERRRSGVL
jgi:hypothetical protein